MLHHTHEGRPTPPAYNAEELSWLTGYPVPDFREHAPLDLRLDRVIERLIELRDALDPDPDIEEDDPPGSSDDDGREPMLGWSETAGRLQGTIAHEPIGTHDEAEESEAAEEDDPAEMDDEDRCQARDDEIRAYSFGDGLIGSEDDEEDDNQDRCPADEGVGSAGFPS